MSEPHPKPTPRPVPKPVPKPVPRPAASPAPQQTQSIQPTMMGLTPTVAPDQALPPQGKSRNLIGPLIILVLCLAVGGGLYLMVKKNREALAAQLAKNAAIEKAEQEALRKAKGLDDVGSQAEPVSAQTNSNTSPDKMPDGKAVPEFQPMDSHEARKFAEGSLIRLRGTLIEVKGSTSKSGLLSIDLAFDGPNGKNQMKAVTGSDIFEGKLSEELFESFKNRQIIVEGKSVHVDDRRDRVFVRFTSMDQIKVVE